jgi:hypothetical protein
MRPEGFRLFRDKELQADYTCEIQFGACAFSVEENITSVSGTAKLPDTYYQLFQFDWTPCERDFSNMISAQINPLMISMPVEKKEEDQSTPYECMVPVAFNEKVNEISVIAPTQMMVPAPLPSLSPNSL